MNSSTGWALLEREPALGEGGRGDPLQRRHLARRLDEVVVGAVAAHERAQVADRRPRVAHERAQLAQERREVLRRRLGLGDQHVEVVERGAQVHERRVGAPQRGRQQLERARERPGSRPRSRRWSRWRWRRGRRGRRGARRPRSPRARSSTMKRVSAPSSSVTCWASTREVDSSGLKYLADCPTSSPLPSYWVAKPWMTSCRSPRVFSSMRVEDLVEVDDRRRLGEVQAGAFVQLLVGVGRQRQRDVAVGDARQRGEADDARGALAQRRVGLLDLDLDRREVVVGQLDRAHGADPPAGDLDVVVLDELARRLEQQRVLVPAAAAEEQQVAREEDGQDERGQRDSTRCGQALLLVMGPISSSGTASPPWTRVLHSGAQDRARYPVEPGARYPSFVDWRLGAVERELFHAEGPARGT